MITRREHGKCIGAGAKWLDYVRFLRWMGISLDTGGAWLDTAGLAFAFLVIVGVVLESAAIIERTRLRTTTAGRVGSGFLIVGLLGELLVTGAKRDVDGAIMAELKAQVYQELRAQKAQVSMDLEELKAQMSQLQGRLPPRPTAAVAQRTPR